jgi:hypothetical protein
MQDSRLSTRGSVTSGGIPTSGRNIPPERPGLCPAPKSSQQNQLSETFPVAEASSIARGSLALVTREYSGLVW